MRQLLSLIFVAAIAVVATLFFSDRKFFKTRLHFAPPEKLKTITVNRSSYPLKYTTIGTVKPHREIIVQAEVSGRIIAQSPDLDVGGHLKEGEMIIKIDPRNYLTAVEQEKAAFSKAELELKMEQGKGFVAKKEWELLESTSKKSEMGQELVLREPHLKEKEAALAAAKSRMEKAQADLSRTTVTAPFDSIVTEEWVEIGQYLNPQSKIANLVSTDEYRIPIQIPYEDLSWIKASAQPTDSTEATVTQQTGKGQKVKWKGFVLRRLGSLDPNGEMANLIIVVRDPLGLSENQDKAATPLLLNSAVDIEIQSPTIENAFVIPCEALREHQTVWVRGPGNTLDIRSVKVAARNNDTAVIGEGLNDGDQVITTEIDDPEQGMSLSEL